MAKKKPAKKSTSHNGSRKKSNKKTPPASLTGTADTTGTTPQQPTKYQKFIPTRVHRSQINEAPWNPREIDPYAYKKLKKNIKSGKIGLIESLVWNKTTGNLVGGHMRLRVLDELHGDQDYSLDVCMVELDPTTEREQNIALNNPDLQGYYKMGLLDDLLRTTPDLDLESTGFDRVSLEEFYQSAGMSTDLLDSIFYPEVLEEQQQTTDEINEILDESDAIRKHEKAVTKEVNSQPDATEASNDTRIQELKDRKKAWADRTGKENEVDYFLTIVFASDEEKRAFCNYLKHNPISSYITSEKLILNAGIEMGAEHG